MKRKSPIRHRVSSHSRDSYVVREYERGKGYHRSRSHVVVGGIIGASTQGMMKLDYSKIPFKFVKAGAVEVIDGKIVKPEIGRGIYAEWDPDTGMVLIDELLRELDSRYLENIKRHEFTEMYLATKGIKEPEYHEYGHLAHHIAVMLHPYPEGMVNALEDITGVKPFPIPTNLNIYRGEGRITPAEQRSENVPFNAKCPNCKNYFSTGNSVDLRVYYICSDKVCTSDKVYYCPKCGERLFPSNIVERAEDIVVFGRLGK